VSPEYEIRAFQESDSIQSVELLKLVFDGWPKFDLKGARAKNYGSSVLTLTRESENKIMEHLP
jgi:hypothetical protein